MSLFPHIFQKNIAIMDIAPCNENRSPSFSSAGVTNGHSFMRQFYYEFRSLYNLARAAESAAIALPDDSPHKYFKLFLALCRDLLKSWDGLKGSRSFRTFFRDRASSMIDLDNLQVVDDLIMSVLCSFLHLSDMVHGPGNLLPEYAISLDEISHIQALLTGISRRLSLDGFGKCRIHSSVN